MRLNSTFENHSHDNVWCVQTSTRLTVSLILPTRKYCPPVSTKFAIDVNSHKQFMRATQRSNSACISQAKFSRSIIQSSNHVLGPGNG